MRRLIGCVLLCSLAAHAQTIKQLEAKARRGDAASEIAAADAYFKGTGGSPNYKKAAQFYYDAAQDGSAYGYFMLGEEYFLNKLPPTKGLLGIPVYDVQWNMDNARINILAAANLNYGPACAWMGWYYEEGYRQGHADVETTSDASIHTPSPAPTGGGFAGGMAAALADHNGSNDTKAHSHTTERVLQPPQYDEAAVWYRRGADHNDPGSEYGLGRLYERGLGVHQDSALALKWYSAAVAQGHQEARIRVELLKEQLSQTKP